MTNAETTMWGIHAGRHGEKDALFLGKKRIALGWPRAGDLSSLGADRELAKSRFAEAYPEVKRGAVPAHAGVLFRFAHEMQEGDIVVYPLRADRRIHIGLVSGPYQYDPEVDREYPHVRRVEWKIAEPRTRFSQAALYETGAAMALFQIKNYADEFYTALKGEKPAPTDDSTSSPDPDEIEQLSRDLIAKQLERELKGHPFAEFVANLLSVLGYNTRVSPPGPDSGVDIIAHQDELGFVPPVVKVQVKSPANQFGEPAIMQFYGSVEDGEFGLYVTLGTFLHAARTFERSKSNLRLIDGTELVSLVLQNYPELDDRYRAMFPLRRVYVPDLRDETEE